MPRVSVAEIKPGDQITSTFLVKTKSLGETRFGKPYLSLTLSDNSGVITARVWEDARAMGQLFQKGDLVTVKATADTYQGEVQLSISQLKRCQETEVDLADYLPTSARDPKEMLNELKEMAAGVENPHLFKLLESFLSDDQIVAGLLKAPAAKGRHHVYLGGLLEHTLSVAKLVMAVAEHYPQVNRDLLLVGAILHDTGKIRELTYRGPFDYSDEGRLLGHILMGIEMVESKLRELGGFPVELALLVKHMILSHHGQYQFQSPVLPQTLEALVLHHVENMDAQIDQADNLLAEARKEGRSWTDFDKLMGRFFYLGKLHQEGEDEG